MSRPPKSPGETHAERIARLQRTLDAIHAENGGKPTGPTTDTMARLYVDLYAPPARMVTVKGRRRRVATPGDVVRLMGEAMLDLALSGGAATEADLQGCGFTRPELLAHGDAARMRARELMANA